MNAEQIQDMIAAGLPCEHVHIEGDGRHWFGTIVSAQFEGLRLIQRHQMVYATLGEAVGREIHALSIQAHSPDEWAAQSGG
jgi:acid stress-induced BolA-like protein IbaG/YrbA